MSARIPLMSGDVATLEFQLTENDGTATTLVAAGALTFKLFAISNGVPAGAALFSKALGAGVVDVDIAASGTFHVHVLNADTAALAGIYAGEVELTDAAGSKRNTGWVPLEIIADLIV